MNTQQDRCSNERGSVTVWMVIVVGSMMLIFGGLVYDAGNAANRNAEIADVAMALARVASAEIVQEGGEPKIDEIAARNAVTELAQQWPDFSWTLDVVDDAATVEVAGVYDTRLLKAIGVTSWEFTSERTAVAQGS